MALATRENVRERFEGVIPVSKDVWLDTRIADVEARLLARCPWLAPHRISTLPAEIVDNARTVVADAVIRLWRNPGGRRSRSAGSFSETLGDDATRTGIYFTDDELASLMLPRKRRRRYGTLQTGAWMHGGEHV